MNEAVLKMFSLGVIALVVCSSLWLAGSVQQAREAGPRMASSRNGSGPSLHVSKGLVLVALPMERAASASMVRSINLR
jgi:hypothetical protein